MAVTPSCDTPVVTTQLRLLNGGELPKQARRPRPSGRSTRAARAAAASPPPATRPTTWLDARTREVGRSGVAEARRRLAEIMATTERVQDLVQAS
jgi:hypothetical protein